MNTPQRFYLITYPRTASNLLIRMLSLDDQPNMATGDDRGGYIFLPVIKLITDMGLRKKSVKDWTEDEIMQIKAAYQHCFSEFQDTLARVSENESSIYVKEHVHFLIDPTTLSEYVFGSDDAANNNANIWTLKQQPNSLCKDKSLCQTGRATNITLLPDEFLWTWKPTFLIRHPALAFPSLYRALLVLEGTGDESEDELLGEHCMTLHWTRLLYDWYSQYYRQEDQSRGGLKWPIVLDADDVMANPKLVAKYSALLGMDSWKLSFSWEPATDTEMSHMNLATKRYLDTLLASGGVLRDKMSGNININKLAKEWRSEFGHDAGQRITQLVKEAMADYEFLKARRLRA
jgi:hypothetical protein